MRQLILKNLVTHRRSNKQTSIIYSMTVSTVILLFVALALQIELIVIALFPYGQIDLQLRVSAEAGHDKIYASQIDPVIAEYADYIEDWAYTTEIAPN